MLIRLPFLRTAWQNSRRPAHAQCYFEKGANDEQQISSQILSVTLPARCFTGLLARDFIRTKRTSSTASSPTTGAIPISGRAG